MEVSHDDSARACPAVLDLAALAREIKAWGRELGFGAVGIADVDVAESAARLRTWLSDGRHGTMSYLERHADLRADPARLLSGTVRVITARLDYLPGASSPDWVEREWRRIDDGAAAVISLYARGRDYHKVLRARLQALADRMIAAAPAARTRACTDSAPVLEVELARKSGIGWRGKHTLLLAQDAGSMFFLGEILTDLPLPVDAPAIDHCGSCRRCIDVCPTQAITAPYELDARRCISYLTIEHQGSIPVEWRSAIGNRVYGCDDCQLACPWNKFAQVASLPDFDVRHGLDGAMLIELFAWTAQQFRERHAGSAILRIGYERWLRNLAVGLGNAPYAVDVVDALTARVDDSSALVREHVGWALTQQVARRRKAPAVVAVSSPR